jgi:DNA-binding NarL/FixJ family response regulator
MPRMNGVEVARRLRDISRATRVIILSGYSDEASVRETLAAGVAGFVVKRGATSDLIQAIREGTRTNVYLSAEVAAVARRGRAKKEIRRNPETSPRPLSPREREVLQLIVEGNTNKQVAKILGITEATAKDHRRHIKEKLGLRDLPSLTRYAIGIGMIRADLRKPTQ